MQQRRQSHAAVVIDKPQQRGMVKVGIEVQHQRRRRISRCKVRAQTDLARRELKRPRGRRRSRSAGGSIFEGRAHAVQLVSGFRLGRRAQRVGAELALTQRIYGKGGEGRLVRGHFHPHERGLIFERVLRRRGQTRGDEEKCGN